MKQGSNSAKRHGFLRVQISLLKSIGRRCLLMFVIISQLEKTLCWISPIEILLDSTHIT